MKAVLKNAMRNLVRTNRNYRPYSLHRDCVCKTFNHGNGALELFRVYENEKIILINSTLFNTSDARKLVEFCRDNHITDYEWKYASYGYPDYYNKGFNLSLVS